MARTLSKTVRVTEDEWRRIEDEAEIRNQSPNHLLVELAVQALDQLEWPRSEHEIRLLRSTLFTAQATARNMIAEGRQKEVEDIRRDISRIVPNLPARPTDDSE